MNEETLRELIARGESAQIEFKSTTGSLTAGIQTVCALLNGARAGWVIFGVRDDGRLVGQDVASSTLEDIARELRRIDPPAFPTSTWWRLRMAAPRSSFEFRAAPVSLPSTDARTTASAPPPA